MSDAGLEPVSKFNMTAERYRFSTILIAILEEHSSESSRELFSQSLEHPEASELVERLIMECRKLADNRGDAVRYVQDKLEVLAETDQLFALTLMTHLYRSANELYAHDVCDAIELWMEHCKSDELRQRLTPLVMREEDQNIRKHFTAWLE